MRKNNPESNLYSKKTVLKKYIAKSKQQQQLINQLRIKIELLSFQRFNLN